MLLVQQAQDALKLLDQSERIHALECALYALDRRAKGILEVRAAEVHEANHQQREEWQQKLQVLTNPAPASMKTVH